MVSAADPDVLGITRRAWSRFEPIHDVVYFSPYTKATTAALGPSITVWSSWVIHRPPPGASPTSAMPPSTPTTCSASAAATVRAGPRRRSANGSSASVATLVAR